MTECGNKRLDDARLDVSSLTLVETVDDNDEGGDVEDDSGRDKLLKWVNNEFTELDVDGLFEDKRVVFDGCRDKLP